MRALKLAGLVTCSIALAATSALAEPRKLDNADLDGVTAGQLFTSLRVLRGEGQTLQRAVITRSFELDRKRFTVRSSGGDGGGTVSAQLEETPQALLEDPQQFVQNEFGVGPIRRADFFRRPISR